MKVEREKIREKIKREKRKSARNVEEKEIIEYGNKINEIITISEKEISESLPNF